jgi:hypothetical protein
VGGSISQISWNEDTGGLGSKVLVGEIARYRQIDRLNFSDKTHNLDYSASVLPHWFDFHTLQLTVAGAAVLCGICAVLSLALSRSTVLRFGLAAMFVAGAISLVAYSHGPLQDAEATCHYRFLQSDLVVTGCAHATSGGSASPSTH